MREFKGFAACLALCAASGQRIDLAPAAPYLESPITGLQFMSAPDLPVRYRLLGLLGGGGSGRVYRAHDVTRSHDLALKLVTGDESAFLKREFGTLRQIRHENLIQVFDWGALSSGESYYTMELIEGEDWGRKVGKPQDAEEVRRILTCLLRGLAHLHCHGEIHGDLKPGNVLLGLGGVVKLADVGMGGSEGRAEGASRTPGYAAPEIWEGSPADIRSDLYSVGVMGYEALTGIHPFRGRTIREVVAGQMEGWVPSPGGHGVRVPPDLERVVMRALERQPGHRQGSADEFMEGMGIKDRVGQILGGKIVGREKEVESVVALFQSREPDRPTLAWLIGPPGIGKSQVVTEIGIRLLMSGVVTCRWARPGLPGLLAALEGAGVLEEGVNVNSPLSEIAECLWDVFSRRKVLIVVEPDDSSGEELNEAARSLARFMWAISQERRVPAGGLLVTHATERPLSVSEFETAIELGPLPLGLVPTLVAGIVGRCHLGETDIRKMHLATGGNPEALRSAVLMMSRAGVLKRNDHRWELHEAEPGQLEALLDSADLIQWSWERLSREQRWVLSTVAVLPKGATTEEISSLSPYGSALREISSLSATGWVVSQDGRWVLSSGALRHAVQRLVPSGDLDAQARDLIARGGGLLGREERADLLLRHGEGSEAMTEGMWAGSEAATRGQFGLAMRRFSRCLQIARNLDDRKIARAAAIPLARCLRQLGRDREGLSILEETVIWQGGDVEPTLQLERLHLKGLFERADGRPEQARESLARALEIARVIGSPSAGMEILCDLAETDWRFGTLVERAKSIEAMREALADAKPEVVGADAVAMLIYGLGAALVRGGERARAREVLRTGLNLPCNEYWQMRMHNALCAAEYYMGELDEALESGSRAIELASKAGFDSYRPRILGTRAGVLYGLGRLREAAAQDEVAANWARRLGDDLEFASACNGAAIDFVVLAQYERALELARRGEAAARRARLPRDIAKSLEVAGLAYYCLGDFDRAEESAIEGRKALAEHDNVIVGPRLDWLHARVAAVRGMKSEARGMLERALAASAETDDREDLLGIKIELNLLDVDKLEIGELLRRVERIVIEARSDRILIAECAAGVALADLMDLRQVSDVDGIHTVNEVLGKAENAGMLEHSWRMSYRLGRLALTHGNQKEGRARIAHALRIIRQIADALSPEHRCLYFEVPYIASALRIANPAN